MTVKETISQLIIDLKPMTLGQKLEHIWTNFKEWILIVGTVLVIAIVYISSLLTAKDTVFTAYMLNIGLSDTGDTVITQDFLAAIGDPESQEIDLISGTYQDNTQGAENNYAVFTHLGAMVSARQLDGLFFDGEGAKLCNSMNICLDLQELLPQEQLESLRDCLLYMTPEGSEAIAAAVDISDTAFAKANFIGGGKYYLAFAGNSEHMDTCLEFLQFVLDYE